MSDPKKPVVPEGVAEDGAPFLGSTADDWAIARERLEAHRRGEVGTISVEEFFRELRQRLAELRADKA